MQDLIYRIKMDFNSEFEALYRRKVQELKRLQDRNKNIRENMLELDIEQKLWEASLTHSECPERLLTVDDSEVNVLMKCLNSGHGSCKVQPGMSECGTALWIVCSAGFVFVLRNELVGNYHHERFPFSLFRLKLRNTSPQNRKNWRKGGGWRRRTASLHKYAVA